MSLIEIKDFSFYYPGAEKASLTSINMTVEEGSFTVLCGPSGCGKSTLLRQLKPVLAAYGHASGELLFDGRSLKDMDQRTQTTEIGFVLQNPDNQIVTDKVWHELAFGLESLGCDQETIRLRVAEMASYFGISNWFMRNVSELSGGQRQLLNLASVMAMHPRLLILDEPTSQLDPIAASDFLETVKKINEDIGTTIILTEHRLQDVIPHADKVVVMDKGTIFAEGTPEEIGKKLDRTGNGMFLAMPVPMQIFAGISAEHEVIRQETGCPLTVCSGRKWIDQTLKKYGKIPEKPETATGKQVNPDKNPTIQKDQKPIAIEVKDVWFRYAQDGKDVIRDLNMKVMTGEFYAIVGGNGTGKSTTLSLLSRVRAPYRGKILLYGKDIRKYSEKELYRGCIGVLPQNPQSMFLKKTVREDLYAAIGGDKNKKDEDYEASMDKSKAIASIAELCNLKDLMDRHPYDLSGGEQQRLALAKVLLLRPRLLLMDEPTKGMDAIFKKEFAAICRRLVKHGLTVLMISHDVEFVAEYTDKTGLFFEGNIVTAQSSERFFAGNSFYTTAANRMARQYYPDAVTGEEVIRCLKNSLTSS